MTKALVKAETASKELSTELTEAGTDGKAAAKKIVAGAEDAEQAINDTADDTTKWSTQTVTGANNVKTAMASVNTAFATLGSLLATVFSVYALVSFVKSSTELASSVEEVQNVVDTAFGDMAYMMEDFAATAIETYGISELTAKQTGSTYMAMATGMGIADEAAADMSLTLTGLTADLASFYNIEQSVANTMAKSVFTGETESLKRLGIVMTEVNLTEYALANGITTAYSAMSQQEKTMLRYYYLLEQTEMAQGDFAKTSESWANQTRVLSERWNEMSTLFGEAFINIGYIALPVINAIITALTYLAEFAIWVSEIIYNAFTGKDLSEATEISGGSVDLSDLEDSYVDTTDAVDDYTDSVTAAATAQSGLDELTVLSDTSSSSDDTSVEDALSSLSDLSTSYDDISIDVDLDTTDALISADELAEKLRGVVTSVGDYWNTYFQPIMDDIWLTLSPEIDEFRENFSNLFVGLSGLATPLQELFTNNITPYLQSIFSLWGTYVTSFATLFNTAFQGITDNVLMPFLDTLTGDILPTFFDFSSQMAKSIQTFVESATPLLDTFIADFLNNIGIMVTWWQSLWSTVTDVWNTYGEPIFEAIRTAITNTFETLQKVYDEIIKPNIDKAMETFDNLWTNSLQPLMQNIMEMFAEIVLLIVNLYNEWLKPGIDFLIDTLAPIITWLRSVIYDAFYVVFNFLAELLNGFVTILKGIIQVISGVITGDWEKAWEGIKNIFQGIWETLSSITNGVLNAIIWAINTIVRGIASVLSSAINLVISGLNTLLKTALAAINLAIDALNMIPGTNISKLSFSIPTVSNWGSSVYQIPYLAQGAVIPPNSEFLAVLGDQKSGTNIEAPLDTIIEAMQTALATTRTTNGGGSTEVKVVTVDGRELLKFIIDGINSRTRQTGVTPIEVV